MEIEKTLVDIRLQLASIPQCPAPGTCLQLAHETERLTRVMEAINNRLNALERAESKLLGIFAAVLFLGGILGTAIHAAISYFKK